MKIEKINKDNIKEYIRDMGIDITYVDEKQLINNTVLVIALILVFSVIVLGADMILEFCDEKLWNVIRNTIG